MLEESCIFLVMFCAEAVWCVSLSDSKFNSTLSILNILQCCSLFLSRLSLVPVAPCVAECRNSWCCWCIEEGAKLERVLCSLFCRERKFPFANAINFLVSKSHLFTVCLGNNLSKSGVPLICSNRLWLRPAARVWMCLYVLDSLSRGFLEAWVCLWSLLYVCKKRKQGIVCQKQPQFFHLLAVQFYMVTSYGQVLRPAHKNSCKLSQSLGKEWILVSVLYPCNLNLYSLISTPPGRKTSEFSYRVCLLYLLDVWPCCSCVSSVLQNYFMIRMAEWKQRQLLPS